MCKSVNPFGYYYEKTERSRSLVGVDFSQMNQCEETEYFGARSEELPTSFMPHKNPDKYTMQNLAQDIFSEI